MEKADAAVAWVDHATGKGFAVDYYLDAKAQCSGKKGSCPDVNIDVSLKYQLKENIHNILSSPLAPHQFYSFAQRSYGQWLLNRYLSKISQGV